MKNIIKSAFLAVLISVFISPFAFSQRNDGPNMKRLKDKLNLSDTQKDQIEKLRIDHQKNMIDLRAKLQKARIEAKDILKNDDLKRNEYLSSQDKLSKIQNEIRIAAANHKMDVFELLNKDQRKILAEERTFKKRQKNINRKGRGGRDFDCLQNHERRRIHQ